MRELPIELLNNILEYAPDHRDKLQRSFKKMRTIACLARIAYLYNSWRKDYRFDFHFYLYLKMHIPDPEHIIANLANCSCCYRHSVLRPCKLNCLDYISYTNDVAPKYKETHGCMCPCRYYCRLIHYTFNGD